MTNEPDFLSNLDELIATATEETDAPAPAQPSTPSYRYLGESMGWDEKWRNLTDEPTGEAWWAAYAKVKRVVENGGIVVLHGTRGGGKTRMSYEIGRRASFAVDKPRMAGGFKSPPKQTARYVTAMGFFLDVRATFGKKSQRSERDAVDMMTEPGLLILDEIQERSESAWENRLLTHVIDCRYSAERPTIIIANLKADELKASLGPSIMDRINENGGSIEFNWESYRRSKR